MEKITAKLLRRKGACACQVEFFEELFPEGVTPTRALCLKYAEMFSWDWAAGHLLGSSACSDYDNAVDVAWDDYQKATAPARAVFEQAIASRQDVSSSSPAWVAFQQAVALALAAYKQAKALAWAAAAGLED